MTKRGLAHERPAPGWFALDVMRANSRKWDWVALMVDVEFDELKRCACDFPALFYVHPKEYRPAGNRVARQRWFRIPTKHRNRASAWDALQDMMMAQLH